MNFPVVICNMKYLVQAIRIFEKALLVTFKEVQKQIISNPISLVLEIYYFIQRMQLQSHVP